MASIRVIGYANADCSREGVTFTEDKDTPAEDFVPHGCELQYDEELDVELPSRFPLETQLEKC